MLWCSVICFNNFFLPLQVSVLVMCHTRELAFQISKEYERFSKYMPTVKAAVFFGGLAIKKDEEVLKKNCPHIVVGTPGRILALIRNKTLSLKNVKHFVLDECDKMLEQLGVFSGFHLSFLSTRPSQSLQRASLTSLLCGRHEAWRTGHLQDHTSREAGHDVQCYSEQGDPTSLPQIHAGCKWTKKGCFFTINSWEQKIQAHAKC